MDKDTVLLVDPTQYMPEEAPGEFKDADSIEDFLLRQDRVHINDRINTGDISPEKRKDTAEHGQHPYAVVITCSDSRVPAEHIFNAGIGELFVIRTAGNVIGDYELGSIEYGAEHLHAKLIVVLGHTQCGAVEAALSGGAHGHIKDIVNEIAAHLPKGCDAREAEIINVKNSISRIMESSIIREMVEKGEVSVRGAIYNIASGEVSFIHLPA